MCSSVYFTTEHPAFLRQQQKFSYGRRNRKFSDFYVRWQPRNAGCSYAILVSHLPSFDYLKSIKREKLIVAFYRGTVKKLLEENIANSFLIKTQKAM